MATSAGAQFPEERQYSSSSADDHAIHDWYRTVLAFPPRLVRRYLEEFGLGSHQLVLDPFCGTGTVLVECKKVGVPSVGIEAHPMAHFATDVKVDWSPEPDGLVAHAELCAGIAREALGPIGLTVSLPQPAATNGLDLRSLPAEESRLLLRDSISPLPLHKVLVLLEVLASNKDERYRRHELLALATSVVRSSSNLAFGPEVGAGKRRTDASVIEPWLARVEEIASDLRQVRPYPHAKARSVFADARSAFEALRPDIVDAVITSPPYPNEKDYTRTARLESVLLGFIKSKAELRALKRRLIRSNTRGIYKTDSADDWARRNPAVQELADKIENRRIEMGKTSGFERMYPRVTKLYFAGMAEHLSDLRQVLRPGAHLAYVVGEQASYLQVMIRTGPLLAGIATSLGYEHLRTDLFRMRQATATRQQLREEVVILRWPGSSDSNGQSRLPPP